MLLNLIWPALYVSQELAYFWCLIFLTIVVEALVLKFYFRFNWLKSVVFSCIGNLVSGTVGTYVMMWGMMGWHILVDGLVPGHTFGKFNWVATYILMCLGSVCLEVLALKLFIRQSFKKLFKPLLLGNAISYIIIAVMVLMGKGRESQWKDPREVYTERIYYVPDSNELVLLDSSKVKLGIASSRLSFMDKHVQMRQTYGLKIPFVKMGKDDFVFAMRLPGDEYSGGISEGEIMLHPGFMADAIRVVLEEKNPEPGIGWQKPLVTDTILFIRLYQTK